MIQRYALEPGWNGEMVKDSIGLWVAFTDHEAAIAAQEKAERDVRLFLAWNHGHQGIYLDDGEIQCGSCGPNWDYRRTPLLTVVSTAITALTESRDKAEERVKELEGERDEQFLERFLMVRGIETLCHKCNGAGKIAYPSTSVWMGGIGGSMITSGVCDHCWGSGDENEHGADLRKLMRDKATLTAERDRMREALGDEKTHSATSDFCSSEWKNDCDELKDLVSRAARIIETVTPGSREEKDEQELWLGDAKAALAEK